MAERIATGSPASAVRVFTPSIGGRVVLRPRLSSVTSIPRATASRLQAELMMPLPPMNSALRCVTCDPFPL
jgi:hypothetical protein